MFFGMPEIYDFPAHQKSLYAELVQIMLPICDGWFLTAQDMSGCVG